MIHNVKGTMSSKIFEMCVQEFSRREQPLSHYNSVQVLLSWLTQWCKWGIVRVGAKNDRKIILKCKTMKITKWASNCEPNFPAFMKNRFICLILLTLLMLAPCLLLLSLSSDIFYFLMLCSFKNYNNMGCLSEK